ncbi:hypothetical protein DY000_02034612 [Brassica cretica]|uniref:Uncharacterized protein n=1 Tax=Brassica cretica TaxID=69181 RepID=A0ABQ7DN99_BRACR|nr:hypothetical protein DY000_02034612 [Brassica cretica]
MRLSLELVHSLAEEPRGKAGSRFVPLMTLRDLRRIFSSGGAWFHLGVPPSRICSFIVFCYPDRVVRGRVFLQRLRRLAVWVSCCPKGSRFGEVTPLRRV